MRPDGTDQELQRFHAKLLAEASAIRKDAKALEARAARFEELVATGQTSTRALVAYYEQAYRRATGQEYVMDGRAAANNRIMRTLLNRLSGNEIRGMIDRFFAEADAWTVQQGYPLAEFQKQVNRLRLPRQAGKGRQTRDAEAFELALERQEEDR